VDDLQHYNAQGRRSIQQGDAAAALEAFERALFGAQAGVADDYQVAQIWNNIGFAHAALGHLEDAYSAYEHALTLYEHLHRDDPEMAIALQNMGRLLQRQGDQKLAWDYLTEALEMWKRIITSPEQADYLPHLAASLYACGEIMAADRKYDQARRNFEQALELRELTLASDHADIAINLASLGMLCRVQGDRAAARAYLQRALDLHVAGLGPDHRIVEELRTVLTDLDRSARPSWWQRLRRN
jgi:tetratricopeptide (TPR) repeat protein